MGNVMAPGPAPPPAPLVLEVADVNAVARLSTPRGAGTEALCAAAVAKNLPALQRLLSLKKSLTKTDREGYGIAAFCVLNRWPQGLAAVVEVGGNIEARTNEGYTPLQLAAFVGDAACAKLLLDAGANVEAKSLRSSTALIFAAQQGRPSKDVLSLLLQRHAQIGTRGHMHRSALEHALVSHGHADVIKLLLDAGADPSACNEQRHNLTPLHEAAHLQRVDAMRVLLEAGADPNLRAAHGLTPMMEVLISEMHPHGASGESAKRLMFTALRDAGADLNATTTLQGFTVLHFAVSSCRQEATLDLILSSNIDASIGINIPPNSTASRNSLLHLCAKRGWARTCKRLAAAGADLHARNKEGFTPLHLAVMHDRPAVAAALLAAGADPHEAAPDIWPSYHAWRTRRGARIMQAVMGGPMPLGATDTLFAELDANEPRASAVDMAVAVVQSVPLVEVFLAAGAVPSREGAALAAACHPLLHASVQRSTWTPELHATLPVKFRSAARELVRCLKRAAVDEHGAPLHLPPDSLTAILTMAMYPLTRWASPAWLASRQSLKPRNLPRPGFEVPQQAAGGAELAMALMPEMLDQILAQIQNEAGGGGMVMVHPAFGPGGMAGMGNWPGGPGGGQQELLANVMAAAAGGGAGPGPQLANAANHGMIAAGPGMGGAVHFIQFEFQFEHLPGGGGGGGGLGPLGAAGFPPGMPPMGGFMQLQQGGGGAAGPLVQPQFGMDLGALDDLPPPLFTDDEDDSGDEDPYDDWMGQQQQPAQAPEPAPGPPPAAAGPSAQEEAGPSSGGAGPSTSGASGRRYELRSNSAQGSKRRRTSK